MPDSELVGLTSKILSSRKWNKVYKQTQAVTWQGGGEEQLQVKDFREGLEMQGKG